MSISVVNIIYEEIEAIIDIHKRNIECATQLLLLTLVLCCGSAGVVPVFFLDDRGFEPHSRFFLRCFAICLFFGCPRRPPFGEKRG